MVQQYQDTTLSPPSPYVGPSSPGGGCKRSGGQGEELRLGALRPDSWPRNGRFGSTGSAAGGLALVEGANAGIGRVSTVDSSSRPLESQNLVVASLREGASANFRTL